MAADRELTFRILTTAETTALDQTARALDDVARGATATAPDLDTAARALDGLDTAAGTATTALGDVDDAARRLELDKVGTEARDAARDVDTAFDAMGRSSADGARKVDTSSDKMRRSLRDVGDEAGDTAREAAASFSGSGDIGDALQEVAANAPATLGPLGLAFGAVAGVGVGLFRAQTEKLKARVDELVAYMQDAGGKLGKEAIDSQIRDPDNRGELQRLKDLAQAVDIAGVSYRDLARAKFGDTDAQKRVNAALDDAAKQYAATTDEIGGYNSANDLMRARIKTVRGEVDESTEAVKLAEDAITNMGEATASNSETMVTATSTARGAWDDLRGSMVDPITGEIRVRKPSSGELAGIRGDIADGIGPIIVPVVTRPSNTSLFYRP